MSTPQPGDQIFAVRFYERENEVPFKSLQEGRPIYEMRDFVRIEIPGNALSIIDTLANEDHKRRFPLQWAHYVNQKGGKAADGEVLSGTLLKDWSLLNAAQVKELEHYRFYTVDQIANASDLQLQSIGMVAGMSPVSLREKARGYLTSARGSAAVMQQAEELAKRDQENEALRQMLREMQQQMADMRSQIEGRDVKRGPGRPRKEEAAA